MAEKQAIPDEEDDELKKSAREMVGKNIEFVEDLQKKAVNAVFDQLHECVRKQKAKITSSLVGYTQLKNEKFEKFGSEQEELQVWNLFGHLGSFVSDLGEKDPLFQLFFLECQQLMESIGQLQIPTGLPEVKIRNFSIPEAVMGRARDIEFVFVYPDGTNFKYPEKFIKVAISTDNGNQTVPVRCDPRGSLIATITPTFEGKNTLHITLCSVSVYNCPIWVQPNVDYSRLQSPTKMRVGPGRPQFMQPCEDGKFLVAITGHLHKNECSLRKFDGHGGRRPMEAGEDTAMEIQLEIKNPGGVAQIKEKIFVVDTISGRLFCYDSSLKPPSIEIVDPEVQLCQPHGICADKDGTLYLADTKNGCIRIYKPDEEDGNKYKQCKTLPDADTPPLNLPIDVALDDHRNLYVTCEGSKSVEVFDSAGRHFQEKSIHGVKDPFGIAVNCLGFVFVALRRPGPRGKIKIFNPQGKLAGMYSGLWFPVGIAVDNHGCVYVTDQRGVYKYTS